MGDIERLVAEADDGTVDEEFLQHLAKGGELLSSGKTSEAKDVLEKAYKLQPKNQKAQNLLGLAYFKQGTFERAAEIYEALVRDNPVDPTLRVNLGLVYLKTNALQRATREFETAVDLAPDHKKAHNYLGLAYAQGGEYARAKDSFVAAGSLTMAERMERALRDPSKAPRVGALDEEKTASPAAGLASKGKKRAPKVVEAKEAEVEVAIEVESAPQPEALEAEGGNPEPAPEGQGETVEPAGQAMEPPAAAEPGLALLSGHEAVPVLTELTRVLAYSAPDGPGPFEVSADGLMVQVQGEVLARLEGLVGAVGALQYVPEMKRFRGKATDKPFGDSERRMVRVSGNGTLLYAPRDAVYTPFELNEESAYFREDLVFAFQESIVFENGRVPSKIAPDLHLVHLRGKGKVLLCLPAQLRSVAIATGFPCAVPLPVLVGWHGTLTPRVVGIPEESEGTTPIVPTVELSGDGFALLLGGKRIE